MNEQLERIRSVFSISHIPSVTAETLQSYFEHLKADLTCPCLLTGIESLGYFSWEGCNRSHNSTCKLSSFRTLTRFKTLAICCLNRRPCR